MKLATNFAKALELLEINDVHEQQDFLYCVIDFLIFGQNTFTLTDKQLDLVFHKQSDGKLRLKFPVFQDENNLTQPAPQTDNLSDFVQKYRLIFKHGCPRMGSQGAKGVVLKKLQKFLNEEKYTQKQILEAARLHVEAKGAYALNADNFLYHKEKGSTILIYLEELKDMSNDGKQVV